MATDVIRFEPILKRLIWGGRKLGTLLGKSIGEESDYAESWELADHGSDVSRVAEGPLAGVSIRELIDADVVGLLGTELGDVERFPLLIKFLDAERVLSVQVHPDDALGVELVGDRGKTEAWVILDTEPGALIYAGLKAGVDRRALELGLERGEVEPLLHRFEPRVGDCVFIPAGTVHAIGAGILLVEVQQMSDATFRLFDWGRTGPDGKPRALHVAESMQAIDFKRGPVEPVRAALERERWGTRERLVNCDYFSIERLDLREGATGVGSAGHFTILIGIEGGLRIEGGGGSTLLKRGETVLLPAAGGEFGVSADVEGTVLVVRPGRGS